MSAAGKSARVVVQQRAVARRELSIGDASRALGISIDTLRYYERIELIPRINRDAGGRRFYGDADLAVLRFVRRAQGVGFTLDEIRNLLKFRAQPSSASAQVREMAGEKLRVVREKRADLKRLHDELVLLVNLCSGDRTDCPILEQLDGKDALDSA